MGAYSTPKRLTDRSTQRKQIEEVLVGNTKTRILEFYGIAGLGKSRVLEEVKSQCRMRHLRFAIHTFQGSNLPLQAACRELLFNICDQIDHFDDTSALRSMLSTYNLDNACDVGVATLAEFVTQMPGKEEPFVFLFDQIENCPQELFDCLGERFVLPLIDKLRSMIVFLAGRGPRWRDSRTWRNLGGEIAASYPLELFSFEFTEAHVKELLSPNAVEANTSKEVYALSGGHPYSIEALSTWVSGQGINVDPASCQREALAQRMYEEVIRRYVLEDAEDWALPFLEIASTFRRFEAGWLQRILPRYRTELASNQPIQWYLARIVDLQTPKLPLILIGGGTPAFELEPALRRLLNIARTILMPEEVCRLHQDASGIWRNDLQLGRSPAASVLEILFHETQMAAVCIGDKPSQLEAAQTTLESLLTEHFKPRDRVEELNILKARLERDGDIQELVGVTGIGTLVADVERFMQRTEVVVRAPTDFQFSHLVIEHLPPSEYRVSWYLANQSALPTELIRSGRQFTAQEWRNEPEAVGRAAFASYLPRRAQEFVRTRRDWAIELCTDWTDTPWELLYDGQEFLCLSRPIARKPNLLKEPKIHTGTTSSPRRALVLGDPTGDLPGAEHEARAVADLLRQNDIKVTLLLGAQEATANNFAIHLIEQPGYDFIHYAGHGEFQSGASSLSYLVFQDGKFYDEELERLLSSPAFVFLSACKGAATQVVNSDIGFRGRFINGLAVAALLGGAAGCLGPMWDIADSLAGDFALEFYGHVLRGQSYSQAVRLARLKVRDQHPDLWANWILYGDPMAGMGQ